MYADCYLGLSTIGRSREQGHDYLRKAMELAITLEDDGAFFAAAAWALNNLLALRDGELVGRIADEVFARPRDGIRSRDLSICLANVGDVLPRRGEREKAERIWRELEHLAERTRDATSTQTSMEKTLFIAFLDGRLEEAASLGESLLARRLELGVSAANIFLGTIRPRDRSLPWAGQFEPLLGLIAGSARPPQAMRAVALSFLGRFAEARTLREGFGDIGSDKDETNQHFLVFFLASAILSEDTKTTGELLPRLAPLAETLSAAGVSIGRLLGGGAKLLGQPEDAPWLLQPGA